MIVNEFTAYSPTFDADVTRLSMVNEQNEEYFCLLPRIDGRAWRKLRQEAIEVLSGAIEDGMRPGEYRWKTDGEGR